MNGDIPVIQGAALVTYSRCLGSEALQEGLLWVLRAPLFAMCEEMPLCAKFCSKTERHLFCWCCTPLQSHCLMITKMGRVKPASIIHQGPDSAVSEAPATSSRVFVLLSRLLQQIVFLSLPVSGGLEPEEGDMSKYKCWLFPPRLSRKEMLHAIKLIMLCSATLVTMQHTHEIEGGEHILPHLEYCRKHLIDLHVGCICGNTAEKKRGGREEGNVYSLSADE